MFLDASKAIDCVYNYILVNEWIRSNLSNRKQYVSIDLCMSDVLNVYCGVPQWSVLGPQICIMYMSCTKDIEVHIVC